MTSKCIQSDYEKNKCNKGVILPAIIFFLHFKKTFNFQISVHPHAVIKNNTEETHKPFTQFLLILTI